MKKVLIGLLVLAVAGGGVFAQEWQFNGEMHAGLGMFIFSDDDDAWVGAASHEGVVRTDLRARVSNADGTAGLDMQFRADGHNQPTPFVERGFGWISFMDNMLTLQGGRINDDAGFNSFDWMTGSRMGEGTGLRLLVRPIDGLVLNIGAYTGAGRAFFDDADQMKGVFAVRYEDPDLFRVVVGARTTNEAGGPSAGFNGWGGVGPARQSLGLRDLSVFDLLAMEDAMDADPDFDYEAFLLSNTTQASAAYLSFEFLGLASDGISLAASAFFLNLEEFGDFGYSRFAASFGHTGLVDGMDLRLSASIGLSQNDFHDDIHLWIWGSVAYQLSDMVVPRLDLHYVMGGRGSGTAGLMHHRDAARSGVTFNSDDSFLRIQPSVQFRVQTNTFFELGCIFNVCLSDSNATGAAWGGGQGNVNVGIYTLMRVAF